MLIGEQKSIACLKRILRTEMENYWPCVTFRLKKKRKFNHKPKQIRNDVHRNTMEIPTKKLYTGNYLQMHKYKLIIWRTKSSVVVYSLSVLNVLYE